MPIDVMYFGESQNIYENSSDFLNPDEQRLILRVGSEGMALTLSHERLE